VGNPNLTEGAQKKKGAQNINLGYRNRREHLFSPPPRLHIST